MANNWSDETMGVIYFDLIEDEEFKTDLTFNSYKKLRDEIIDILHPNSESRFLIAKLDLIQQRNFTSITDYFKKIKKSIEIISLSQKFSQREFDRLLSDTFFRGLATHTSLKLLDAGLDEGTVSQVLKYLKKYEDRIILQANLSSLSFTSEQSTNPENKPPASSPTAKTNFKWCTIHHMKSPNTKDCTLNRGSSVHQGDNSTTQKSLLISEFKEKNPSCVEIESKIKGEVLDLVVDSGSNISYVSEKVVERLSLTTLESDPITLVFGGGAKEDTNQRVDVTSEINGKQYTIPFYVLKSSPVDFILGNDLLSSHDCMLDYGNKVIIIEKNNHVPFKGEKKTIEEILDARLSEKICLSIIEDYPNLTKNIKNYYIKNHSFSYIDATPAKFIIKSEIPLIQSIG